MEEELFGLKWVLTTSYSDKYGAIYSYQHNDFGIILLSDEANNIALSSKYKDKVLSILAVLREFHLQNKNILLCIEEEKKRLDGVYSGKCIQLTFEQILSYYPTTISSKEDRILLNLSVISPGLGTKIDRNFTEYDFFVNSKDEIYFMLRVLQKHEYLSFDVHTNGRSTIYDNIEITENGWIEIEKSTKRIGFEQAFIAMWFNPDMDECLLTIEECCRNNGFKPMCIKNKEHNNEISGEILKEIRKSGFMIADVTGQRQGVYFEAGFAMALEIPVIWTCREDHMKDVHFDTRQYNHVVWKDIVELKEKLSNRIKGTIK